MSKQQQKQIPTNILKKSLFKNQNQSYDSEQLIQEKSQYQEQQLNNQEQKQAQKQIDVVHNQKQSKNKSYQFEELLRTQINIILLSVIENNASIVGLAIFNLKTGEIILSQIVDRLTYVHTISTILRYSPQEIIFCEHFQNSLLNKKIAQTFRNAKIVYQKRFFFDENKGQKIYNQSKQNNLNNSSNLLKVDNQYYYVGLASLNALILHLEMQYQLIFSNNLVINFHNINDFLTIDLSTIFDLEILLNSKDFTISQSLVNLFKTQTVGGQRLLRASLLQPLNKLEEIQKRQEMINYLEKNPSYQEQLQQILKNFKDAENITIKGTGKQYYR
ncbi:DNA mismatch repair protein MutS, core [Pseudocohnilembus persalinus]|uniref:DNA mismatch repair protein MutS, core n=1 Tax=Pseudocohnilembus persalinus TaxID=266149 RepID=A0A0V0QKW8_PSEPJ|nr:DNA mismatch repair protein MutS, core [Pseudocohnilembus persalinus]|eukprot:KRX02748.1 DNA mismatch repair protein MutS, core [Pseudocohnilembus persalinus]